MFCMPCVCLDLDFPALPVTTHFTLKLKLHAANSFCLDIMKQAKTALKSPGHHLVLDAISEKRRLCVYLLLDQIK